MRIRSTGLGKRELIGKIEALTRAEGGYLIMSIQTTEPVKWHVRVAIGPEDLADMVKMAVKGPVLPFVVAGIAHPNGLHAPAQY